MFGFLFQNKVRNVLRQHFNYRPNLLQSGILRTSANEARVSGANEYDAAIMFMLTQMNMLLSHNKEVNEFIDNHSDNIMAILYRSTDPNAIIELINKIRKKHNLRLISRTEVSDRIMKFEDWHKIFMISCQSVNPRLGPDKNGQSPIDFVPMQPLKMAFNKGLNPVSFAISFAHDFNIDVIYRKLL